MRNSEYADRKKQPIHEVVQSMNLRGLSTINFWAPDVAAATARYAQFLGLDSFFERPGPEENLAYTGFPLSDFPHELGIIDSRCNPSPAASEQSLVDPFGSFLGVMPGPQYRQPLPTSIEALP
ncbi:hypothetical protein [Arthrobacter sp. GMC3]|uniref:hypothetical protein n=1 Tax=Arthrobacter sp. GMC3 TaxID=2058894 RepID=UPI001CA559E9|nr:hypothetical protein [Arthrobacter sp. GMC3]